MSARGFLGAGDLYIARFENGQFSDYEGPFECGKFEIKPNVDLKEKVSKGKLTYGQVIETVAIPKPADLTVEMTEVNKQALAIALLGTIVGLNQSAGSVTDEAVVAKLGYWKQLSKARLNTAGFVVTNSAATITYVEGVDYIVNYTLGWFKALAGGQITEGQSLKIDFAHLAITGSEIKGATQTQVRAKFKLDGVNFADNLPVIVTVHEAVIAADSAFDILGDDFATVSLPGRMKTPSGFVEPFNVHLRDA